MDFVSNGSDTAIGDAVADMVRTRISEGQNVTVVERGRIRQVTDEQNLQLWDRIDPATAVKLGRMLGAEKMVFGAVNRLADKFVISVREIDVETGVVDGQREVTCRPCVAADLQEAVIVLKGALVK